MDGLRVHRFYHVHRVLNFCINWWPGWIGWLIRLTSLASLWLIAAFVVLVRVADPDGQANLPAWAIGWLGTIHQNRFLIVVLLIGVQAICQFLLWVGKQIGQPEAKKIVPILDLVVDQVFPNQDRRNHIYRATLFKSRRCWLLGRWLGIFSRSGKMYRKRQTIFSISHESKVHCTGLAGECWKQDGITFSLILPDCRTGPVTEDNMAKYHLEGCLDPREYTKMAVKSQVFLLTGIRVAGQLWGILVVDSTDPTSLPSRSKQNHDTLKFAAVTIGQLVS